MYVDCAEIDPEILFQGDVIDNISFFLLNKTSPLIEEEDVFRRSEATDSSPSLHAVVAKRQRVILLSQSCDLQRRENIVVCPVYPLVEFVADNTLNSAKVDAIRQRDNNYLFYLPEFSGLPESIADLQTMQYISRSVVESHKTDRIASMSDLGRHHLGWALATYFGRPAIS